MLRSNTSLLVLLICASCAQGQAVLTGRLLTPRGPGASEMMPLSAVMMFASLDGADSQAVAFRTWETQPAGWYRLAGASGNYTVLFSTPAHFMRPLVLTNIHLDANDTVERALSPRADYAVFHEGAWDPKAATDYYQTFVAGGTSLTQIGFRLVHDGIDGAGPGSQNLLVSIHRRQDGNPDAWPQVGPTVPVLDVDCGGPKNYIWSAGFDSGEVPLTPGQTYAVHLRAEKAGNGFQAFWLASDDKTADCYRVGPQNTGWQGRKLWMSIGTDGDGLLIPFNKRVHKQFVALTKFSRKWSQAYVAQGRGLAGVVLYAACSGVQPSQNRQRVAVRVREGGPDGPLVGMTKIAIGNANYTGDASWGTFGVAFAPGEVPLKSGATYVLEFESIENYETLHGFVNIKKQVSDDRPGFNPYRKHERDAYEKGRAYRNGTEAMDYSLDMQVIEYEHAGRDWRWTMQDENLVNNGDMSAGKLADDPAQGRADGWTPFSIDRATVHHYLADGAEPALRFVRVTGMTADGGYVQRIDGLARTETYRLSARVRCSFAVDDKRQCMIGYDVTGQTENPDAPTIVWAALPRVHGVWVQHSTEPIRPRKNSLSVFLRARCGPAGDFPFKADFGDVRLQKVRTSVP